MAARHVSPPPLEAAPRIRHLALEWMRQTLSRSASAPDLHAAASRSRRPASAPHAQVSDSLPQGTEPCRGSFADRLSHRNGFERARHIEAPARYRRLPHHMLTAAQLKRLTRAQNDRLHTPACSRIHCLKRGSSSDRTRRRHADPGPSASIDADRRGHATSQATRESRVRTSARQRATGRLRRPSARAAGVIGPRGRTVVVPTGTHGVGPAGRLDNIVDALRAGAGVCGLGDCDLGSRVAHNGDVMRPMLRRPRVRHRYRGHGRWRACARLPTPAARRTVGS